MYNTIFLEETLDRLAETSPLLRSIKQFWAIGEPIPSPLFFSSIYFFELYCTRDQSIMHTIRIQEPAQNRSRSCAFTVFSCSLAAPTGIFFGLLEKPTAEDNCQYMQTCVTQNGTITPTINMFSFKDVWKC